MNTLESKENNTIFEKIAEAAHEKIVYGYDQATGLKAIIAIHSTALGPALGGTRIWHYGSDEEALIDVLRLSKGMTYKTAIVDVPLGGGKAVIIGDANTVKTQPLLNAFGKLVDSFQGNYITAADVNITLRDILCIAQATRHIVGLPVDQGGSGDHAPVTALGVYFGIKAAVKKVYGTDSLQNKKIGVEGVGNVGKNLVKRLCKEGAEVYVCDILESRLKAITQQYPVKTIPVGKLYDQDLAVYSPCALGATINDKTINRFQCKIIAGAANNQLEDEERHGSLLLKRGIVHAPDFLINSGGVINVYPEICQAYNPKLVDKRIEKIYDTCLAILKKSEQDNSAPQQVAKNIAEERINKKKPMQ